MIVQMKVDLILTLLNEHVLLRKANEAKTEEYAERMKAGVTFPPIIVGTWPGSDKYGSTGIVDGIHRVGAAVLAGLKEMDVERKSFDSLPQAMAFMYTVNMSHGLPPTEGQRNARIKLLKQLDPKATLDTLADQFKLGRSSIDRILKDQQGEGPSGRKKGANERKDTKKPEPLKPKPFFVSLERVVFTLSRVRPTADIAAYMTPEGDKGPIVDKEKMAVLKESINLLKALYDELA